MNKWDAWVYVDGPEPALVREMFALVRAPAPAPAPDAEAFSQRVMDAIQASRSSGAPVGVEQDGIEGDEDGIEREEEDDEGYEEEEEAPVVEAGSAVSEATGAAVTASVAGGGVPRTALALDVPPEMRALPNAMPFVPEDQVPSRAPLTVHSNVSRRYAGQTTPVGDDTLSKLVAALPFVGASGDKGPAGGAAAEQARAGAEERGEGGLTFKEYASLLVELRSGQDRGHVLRRYRVEGDGVMERVVGYWEERMARAPEVRRQIEEAMEQSAAWLRSHGPA